MNLGVNGLRLLGKRSGVGRAIEAILGCLGEIEHPFREIRVYSPAPLDASMRLPANAKSVVLPSRLSPGLWEQLILPSAARREMLFCPSYVVPLLARGPTFLVHHGSYEGYPEAFPWWPRTRAKWIYKLSARKATRVSTVSEHSKRDMVRFYGVSAASVQVIPEGVDTRFFRPIGDRLRLADWRRRTLGEDAPFLLYVGKPTRRRNLPELVRAFGSWKRAEGLPHKLVLIGCAATDGSRGGVVRAEGLEAHVAFLGHVEHTEIALAYNACDMLVYPSSYEGFGMPVLEAMACGTPAIAIDNTAFPEFAGGVACLLPDARVETLRQGIGELFADRPRRERMGRDGPIRAAAYDWRVVTRRYVEALSALGTASEGPGAAR